ncbi:MAG: CidA/LrgA family protein [Rhodopseudomonas sp.]|uniref:CidA/LrgA family protein n=1 Tax=unclassified Rhodopseudomonas TaxID=2638247 RepID=UPI0013E04146|nr:CidA/LrgA family protein [Rhodopseudomonas sp. BR0M22]MCD0417511.1 CidA/LrgA family protein [Rubrivivax sp. JA1024]NEW91901.1 CidA/LrgA family protein [Rhodopseudomonas sp. BR0M22]
MIASLGLILLCQLAGEVIARGLGLPLPSPVLGLMLLFCLLVARDYIKPLARGPLADGGVEDASKGMLAHLSLLFVPAGVGVIQQLDMIAAHGVAIMLVLAGSVLITLVVTVVTFVVVARLLSLWVPR